jgi:hypothetical protein
MPRGYGGAAILWRKDIDTIVTSLTIGNNRIPEKMVHMLKCSYS